MTGITTRELLQELQGYTGTETWWRHWANRKVTYTDGVKEFADKAGAHWFLDILATELPKLVREHRFLEVWCKVTQDEKAELLADNGADIVWRREITWTDCPVGEWKFLFADGGPEGSVVILLQSEY
jgi:hypothetical protein